MFILGHHIYEWERAIERRLKHIATWIRTEEGNNNAVAYVKTHVPDRVKGKDKLIKEIERQLVDNPNRAWDRGHVVL